MTGPSDDGQAGVTDDNDPCWTCGGRGCEDCRNPELAPTPNARPYAREAKVVTEVDRQNAWVVMAHLPISLPSYQEGVREATAEVIAAALAAERAKARAPFLALLTEYDEGRLWSSQVVDRIRRTAEEGQQ